MTAEHRTDPAMRGPEEAADPVTGDALAGMPPPDEDEAALAEVQGEDLAETRRGEEAAEPDDRRSGWAVRWDDIQIRFVDEPRQSIEEADALVDEVIGELTARLVDERQRLERQWSAGAEPSTEDLRVALQHYRAFFDRLLAA